VTASTGRDLSEWESALGPQASIFYVEVSFRHGRLVTAGTLIWQITIASIQGQGRRSRLDIIKHTVVQCEPSIYPSSRFNVTNVAADELSYEGWCPG